MKLGLDAVRRLLVSLGGPGLATPTLLIAGTNGKGSTAAMAAAILEATGARTLLYTSPHVASVRERVVVSGAPIPAAALERHLAAVRRAASELVQGGVLESHPTFFEVLTAAALLHGRGRRVRAQVLEVGLGGRYDATNVVPAAVAVITTIGLEHTAHLGRTLARIAWNKAGIIRPGQTVITGVNDARALAVIRRIARKEEAQLLRLAPGRARGRSGGRWDLDLRPMAGSGLAPRLPPRLEGVRLGLPGGYQGANAVLAVGAAAALAARLPGVRLTGAAVRRGLAAARLPGRLEVRRMSGQRLLVLDAAHNPAAAQALAAALPALAGSRPVTLLFGLMADKDAPAMARILFPLAERVILCRPRTSRSLAPRRLLAARPGDGPPARVVEDPAKAFARAREETPPGGLLLVAGSFYLLGDLRPLTARYPRK